MRQPYTYLLGWPEHNRWYYGVRYAEGCHPDELWVTYKTSSTHVADFAGENGDPSVIQVRELFEDINHARLWEHRVLRRMKVIHRDEWLNETDNISIAPQIGDANPSKRPEVRSRIRATLLKTAPRGDEHPRRKQPELYAHIGELFKGRNNWWSEGDNNPMHRPEVKAIFKEKYSGENSPNFGRKATDETKKLMSSQSKGKPKSQSTCPHCQAVGGAHAMARWHFDHCPQNPNSTAPKVKRGHSMKKTSCPHCKFEGAGGAMKRHHFENCKMK